MLTRIDGAILRGAQWLVNAFCLSPSNLQRHSACAFAAGILGSVMHQWEIAPVWAAMLTLILAAPALLAMVLEVNLGVKLSDRDMGDTRVLLLAFAAVAAIKSPFGALADVAFSAYLYFRDCSPPPPPRKRATIRRAFA